MKIEPVDFLCVSISQRDQFNSARGLTEGSVPTPAYFEVQLAPVRIVPSGPRMVSDESEGCLHLDGAIVVLTIKGSPGFFTVGRRYNLSVEEKR
jgi:hypothetical protein